MWGGAEQAVSGLRQALLGRGFDVHLIEIPVIWGSAPRLIRSCLMWRLLDLTVPGATEMDIVIAAKFPSYFVRHPRKVVWLIHQYRPLYDQAELSQMRVRSRLKTKGARRLMSWGDRRALTEAERVFTISKNVSRRLSTFNGIQARHLYPPPPHLGSYRTDGFGDYVFTVSRLEAQKRIGLLVEAMQHVDRRVKCLIAGTGPEAEALQRLISRLELDHRVQLIGPVNDETLLRLYAGAFSVYFGPLDEDLGLVTLEAMASGKPVLTLADSGGPLEFVEDGVTGWVMPPHADAIAAAVSRAYAQRNLCREMGAAGRQRVMAVNWDHVVDTLVGTPG
jgi:glycosyltransferase involved in cell wall biosynthesis